jgi:type II secretory pathway component PulL
VSGYLFIYNSFKSFDEIHYAVADNNCSITQPISISPSLEDIKTLCKDKKVVLLLSGTECNFISSILPAKNRKKAIDAVAFSIEDKLNEDITNLLFINQVVENYLHTIVVSKTKIKQIVENYTKNDIKIDFILPIWVLLPFFLEQITLYQLPDDMVAICMDKYRLTCHSRHIDNVLGSMQKEYPDANIYFYYLKGVEQINITCKIKKYEYCFISETVKGFVDNKINLIQKEKIQFTGFAKLLKQYKIVFVMLLLFVVSYLPNFWTKVTDMQVKNSLVEQGLKEIISRSFPSLKNAPDKFIKLQQKIATIKRYNSQNIFLQLLNATIKHSRVISGLILKEYKFDKNVLEIVFLFNDTTDINLLKKKLAEDNLKIISEDRDDKKIRIRITKK